MNPYAINPYDGTSMGSNSSNYQSSSSSSTANNNFTQRYPITTMSNSNVELDDLSDMMITSSSNNLNNNNNMISTNSQSYNNNSAQKVIDEVIMFDDKNEKFHEQGVSDHRSTTSNNGLKSKIKNKLKKSKKNGKIRFEDEVDGTDDNDGNDSLSEEEEANNNNNHHTTSKYNRSGISNSTTARTSPAIHYSQKHHPSPLVIDDSEQQPTPAKALPTQKQDQYGKGFTEVILPPLSPQPPQNTSNKNYTNSDPATQVKEENPIPKNPSFAASSTNEPVEDPNSISAKLMKGDTPHWLFLLTFVIPTIVICSILGGVQLGLCGYFFEVIDNDPTFKSDPNALTWEHNCTLLDTSYNCAERGKYLDRGLHCYFRVQFLSLKNSTLGLSQYINLTSNLPYNMAETGLYYPMKEGDVVKCYTNKQEDQVNILEAISPLFETYYMVGGILGVFGAISLVAAVCVIPTAFVRPKNRIY
ncbi:hypothetical protein FDP41_002525 [Naegleria fowleri]|uniref:Uncharacterized protein n=1 Tax=Naegleria fowleri TaxID=5763 RepID=A0A6A5BZF3_NAEFO|nr:uncharacterized protein FDP41_002525 [Naegleria fowleri]KAF0978705.1 hypothetical protein FDP41_002525 [Naegleria fowleri]CAG4714003.1 unnamed protein product [Naegleria fowleri]